MLTFHEQLQFSLFMKQMHSIKKKQPHKYGKGVRKVSWLILFTNLGRVKMSTSLQFCGSYMCKLPS